MNNQLIKANPTHVVGATRPAETQGVTNSSQTPASDVKATGSGNSFMDKFGNFATVLVSGVGFFILLNFVIEDFSKATK